MSVSSVNASTSPLSLLSTVNQAANVKAKAQAASSTSSSTTSSTTDDSGLTDSTTGTTFLNLLVKELQNQDPDSPMDSTAMVGQMISLNQLDELMSINQDLTATTATTGTTTGTTTDTTTGSGASAKAQTTSSAAVMAERASLLNNGSNFNTASAAAMASDPSTTLNFSALNTSLGGK